MSKYKYLPDEFVAQTEKFIFEKAYVSVCTYKVSNQPDLRTFTGPCHGGLWGSALMIDNGPNIDFLAGAMALQRNGSCDYGASYGTWSAKDDPELRKFVLEFSAWVISPDSVWVGVHKNCIEPMYDATGDLRGFVLGPEALKSGQRGGLFNFLIGSRIVRDHSEIFRTYGFMKHELGLDDLQSFILSPYFSFKDGRWMTAGRSWDANHTPFKEGTNWEGRLDFERLKQRSFDFNTGKTQSSSYGWMDQKDMTSPRLSERIASANSIKTKFSSLPSATPESIVKLAKELFSV